jgi:hypothetical protein
MFGFVALTTAATMPLVSETELPCDSIRQIEAASTESPRPFASLRQQSTAMAMTRNEAGQRVQQQVPVTLVKPIGGFERCRFVYTSQIDLACYVGTTISDDDGDARAARLSKVSENVGACLRNPALMRVPSEESSTPSVGFSGGAGHPFWQISIVPTEADRTRLQAEVMVLGPAQRAQPAPATASNPRRAPTKTKRKRG